jgi:hypothetical protein
MTAAPQQAFTEDFALRRAVKLNLPVVPDPMLLSLVGVGIFFMNLDAAREVYEAAREEHALSGQEDET